jgi:ferredoxin--NADP+ reductase
MKTEGIMFKILDKADLAARVNRYIIEAPDIARRARPGQFVILRLDAHGERIPITIADSDADRGTITLYVQQVGKTTIQMSRMKSGDSILDVVGPLGKASVIEKRGTVVAVGGGFGIAALHPIVRALTVAGNKTVSLIGARTAELIILKEEMEAVSTEVRIATQDGSLGKEGLVTDLLQDMLDQGETVDQVYAIGPVAMMQAVADVTRPYEVPTVVSMNPIMMDGTGMCGACRVMVDGAMKFACVDGPEFDGHKVDYDALINRLKIYKEEERDALEKYLRDLKETCAVQSYL